MNKGNNIFTPESLIESANANSVEIDGKWVPARPMRLDGIIQRIKNAHAVFKGDYDLIRWYKQ